MRNTATIAGRELGAYFLSPIAYAVMAIFLFATGMAFGLGIFANGREASLRFLFDSWILLILLFVLPMLTMRLVADELRMGTVETLMTAPISDTEIVLGKFFGALGFFAILLLALLIYPILLAMYGPVDLKLLANHGIGVMLVGALYISVGLFFSSCTKHQVIAVLISFALLALMTFASHAVAREVETGWLRALLQQVSVASHFYDFVRGMLDLNHVVFFVSMTALFLFLSVKRLEMRRW